MTKLSVNINKIATLRNARGGNIPNVLKAALDCEAFGADGITVHPRPDERHIRYADVYEAVKTEMDIPSKLLEHVAGRIIRSLFDKFPTIEGIELQLFKRTPPMEADIETAGVEIKVKRPL